MMELLQPVLIISLLAAICVLFWKSRGGSLLLTRQRRRLEILDRIALTHQHSIYLLRAEDRSMTIAVTPKGVELLGTERHLAPTDRSIDPPPPKETQMEDFDLRLFAKRGYEQNEMAGTTLPVADGALHPFFTVDTSAARTTTPSFSHILRSHSSSVSEAGMVHEGETCQSQTCQSKAHQSKAHQSKPCQGKAAAR